MLSPLVVFTHKKIWTIPEMLGSFYDSNGLGECCTALKDGLNGHIERGYPRLEILIPP